jgi:mitochondrial splicing suppressor protein 51
LRQEDNVNLEGIKDKGSVYKSAQNSLQPFKKFLGLAASRQGLLPSWWSDAKRAKCEQLGLNEGWSSLARKVTKLKIIERYGDDRFPMQLRMLGEVVYQRGPGGQDGTGMRVMMRQMEERDVRMKGMKVSMMSI